MTRNILDKNNKVLNWIELKEFKINDYITLKPKGNETIIYIKGERFINCKKLVLEVPVESLILSLIPKHSKISYLFEFSRL